MNKKMKTNLFRTIILPLLWRGVGGGVLLLPAPAMAQTFTIYTCDDVGYTLVSDEDAVSASAAPVTYTWYENGEPLPNSNTPSIGFPEGKPVGTYTYVRKAANEECTDVPSNTYIVVVSLCFASTQTWSYGGLTWSDRVTRDVPNCKNTEALSGTTSAAEYKVIDNCYYYTWTCVVQNQDVLCKPPWRVPTFAEYTALLGAATNLQMKSMWGLRGYVTWTNAMNVNIAGYYWSSTETDSAKGNYLSFSNSAAATAGYQKGAGMPLPCVK